jgi:hypothetical protein
MPSTGRAGAHQVQRALVGRAAADQHRHVEVGDEALEVQRLVPAADVLGRHDRALDDEQVDPGVEHGLRELHGPLRRQRRGDGHAGVAHLLHAAGDQLGPHRLGVHLPHPVQRLPRGQPGDLLEHRLRVLVPRPEALEVQHAEAAEAPDGDARLRGHDGVHRAGHQRQLEAVGVQLPRDRDVLRVARAPRGDDGEVVEAVRPPPALADPDLDVGHLSVPSCSWGPRRSSARRAGGSP